MTIRVLLADDQALLRATFRILIDSCEDMEVVAEAADGA
jgi:DNA-binding NarL/FixJ family response regulator